MFDLCPVELDDPTGPTGPGRAKLLPFIPASDRFMVRGYSCQLNGPGFDCVRKKTFRDC